MNEKQTEFFDKYHNHLFDIAYNPDNGFAVAEYFSKFNNTLTNELINEALDVDICVNVAGYSGHLEYNTALRLALAFRNIGYHWRFIDDAIVHITRNSHGEELANKLKTTLGLLE